MEENRLFLLDAYALIFRAYYALIRNPRFSSKGIDTSAIFGFVNTLHELIRRENPSHIAVCFDPPGGTFRHKEYPLYKAQREATPEGIKVAVPFIKRILQAYGIAVFEVPNFEADDVIGTIATKAAAMGFSTLIVTGDKDFGQLVTEQVKIYHPGDNAIFGPEEIKAKYGILSPLQVIDILGLMGDSADNIPGCPGVGPKTAEKLIQRFGSVENLLDNTAQLKGKQKLNVEQNAKQIRFSKYLATIKTDVPLDFDIDALRLRPMDKVALKSVFDELEFKSLTARILGIEPADSEPAQGTPQASAEKKAAQATAPDAQPSLFSFDESETQQAPESQTPEQKEYLASHPYSYSLVSEPDEVRHIVQAMLALPQVGIAILARGDEAMRASLLGIALSNSRRKAYFIPVDGFGWILDELRPLFAGNTTIVGNDIKRIIVILHCYGVEFTAPYFDTAVAHYLLQPERNHSVPDIAPALLHYECLPPIAEPMGRSTAKQAAIPTEKLSQVMCELADLNLALVGPLVSEVESCGMTSLLRDIEMPLVRVLADMEIAGARIDVQALNDYSIALTEQMNALEQECFSLAGTSFNTASPAQVGEILFDRLKIDVKAKKTKTGQYSTTEEVLMHLQDRHPLVGKILELRGIRKLLSTYVNALPALINPATGRIHTTYNQTVTATGRLSSVNPNLQNIPIRTDEGREIRRAFIPSPGNVFFSADYSQIELRLVADLSKDPTMLHAFSNGHDIHAITASKIYHEPLESVTPDQRRKAKTANFGILYGISAFGLSERLQIPRAESKMLIDGYFATFPQVRTYIDNQVALAREKGFVTTLYGRRRMLPDINSRNAVVRSFSERNAINAPIQGTAADIIKIAMNRIYRRFTDEGLKSKMILQVHDELNFDVVPDELERVTEIVVAEMESAYKGDVTLIASHAAASNWLDAH